VAHGQDRMRGFQHLAAIELDAAQTAVLDQQIAHLTAETHFAAELFDLLAHARDHAGETKGADVRLADVENLFRRSGPDELMQHLAAMMARVLDLAVQLAVAEQARAALTELH